VAVTLGRLIVIKWKHTGFIAAVGIIAFVAGRSLPVGGGAIAAQPEKKADKPAQPDKKPGDAGGMPEMPKTGPEHKALDILLGDWEGTVKFWMAPGAEPMESKGTIHREWVLDGRFVKEDVVGDPMGGDTPFKGLGYVGYNQIDKKYESIWMENMAMHISMSTGTYDAAKKTFTFQGDMLDPMDGKRKKQTSVIDHSGPDKEVMTGTCAGPDGKPFKNFEGVFQRKKK
jgi:hypothetical protein